MSPENEIDDGILDDTAEYVDVTVGLLEMQDAKGRFLIQKDYRVSGEVWRVHKSDADPYPSSPHAHCIGGADRFIGYKLHLGTAELYDKKNKALGFFLEKKKFLRLIAMIQPKFPRTSLPLKS
jgi:hypothetical protein